MSRTPLHDELDGPALDPGVQSRLHRLDPNLRITWSRWQVDGRTSLPIVTRRGERIYAPAFTLWLWSPSERRWFWVQEYAMRRRVVSGLMTADGMPATRMEDIPIGQVFGHVQVADLEGAPSRKGSPGALARKRLDELAARKIQKEREHKQRRKELLKANRKRIGALVFDGKSGKRQAKIVSFAGQVNHSTPGQILEDARKDGWEGV